MPKYVNVSDDHIEWLRENHEDVTLSQAANHVGVCVDTLKRILVREGIRDFEGAKYVVARQEITQLWERPCMDCGDKEPRPKNWYYCKKCRGSRGFEDA